uniref:Uncharacterized protein n=1 Tax=Aegilops tauschii subsp. strangulata TaxID=200361 RepID=A0A453ESR2_AEGTS
MCLIRSCRLFGWFGLIRGGCVCLPVYVSVPPLSFPIGAATIYSLLWIWVRGPAVLAPSFSGRRRRLVGSIAPSLSRGQIMRWKGNCSVMPLEIMALVGRKYVVEVSAPRYSFRRDKDALTF